MKFAMLGAGQHRCCTTDSRALYHLKHTRPSGECSKIIVHTVSSSVSRWYFSTSSAWIRKSL